MSRIDEARNAKLQKRTDLESLGVQVHPYSFAKTHTVAQARALEGTTVTTAGRLLSVREHGKLRFFDLNDSTATIQVLIRKDELPAEQAEQLGLIDRGDFLGVTGEVGTSKSGELSIYAKNITFLGKSLRPIPSEFNAADDKEARFRKRYLDMLINPETRRVLDARWLIEKEVRRYLQDEYDFVEVETPIFQPLYGGTNAKPFTTHMNALDCDFYLRLAPELYLKRLIVGGYDKVFEIARNFRNEGIDQTHQPEFTMIEWYETYADYNRMMDVAEGLLKHIAMKLYGNTTIQVGEKTLEIGGTWPRISMETALAEHAGIVLADHNDEQLQSLLAEHHLKLNSDFTRGKAMFALFDELVTPKLIEPTWITDYPRDISPLSKQHRSRPELAERFEAYIGGKELADGWSEITDPLDQRNIFENEQKNMRAGDTEAHPLDEDFIEAMEYGMPPLGGIGMGIDRLVMFLTNTWSIKEVIAFPTLRPLNPVKVVATASATPAAQKQPSESVVMPPRAQAEALLEQFIENEKLRHHCRMVATAMEAAARELGEDPELWYQTGLLHDLDWEKYPDEHPNYAIANLFSEYPQTMRDAIAAHAPDRTGKQPKTLIERYLFATDELSGLMHAISLMRPTGFDGMEVKSVKKKLKDKSFAANVSREDIAEGMRLIGKTEEEWIGWLIAIFNK